MALQGYEDSFHTWAASCFALADCKLEACDDITLHFIIGFESTLEEREALAVPRNLLCTIQQRSQVVFEKRIVGLVASDLDVYCEQNLEDLAQHRRTPSVLSPTMRVSFLPDRSKSHLPPRLVCNRSDHFGHADALASSRGLPSHQSHRLRHPRRCNPKDMLMNPSCRSFCGCVEPYLTQRGGVYIIYEHVGASLPVSQSRACAPTCSSNLTDVRLPNDFCKLEHVKQTQCR